MKIGIITIGNELLNGMRIDTNSSWIGESVQPAGGNVVWKASVVDDKNQIIHVDKRNTDNAKAQSKLIKISLLTPNLGDRIESIEKMSQSDLAWSTSSLKEIYETESYQIIYEHETLSPWKLIRKNR